MVVLGLPRGGVPVAYEVAEAFGVPLDVFVVRKLGAPGREELAVGAIASGGAKVINRDIVDSLALDAARIDEIEAREREELRRRERLYRGDRPTPELAGKTALLVDDGLATGASMRAAVDAVRALDPARVVVAVPTAAADTCDALAREVDAVVCVRTPRPFFGVGRWYRDFHQVSDDEVRQLLSASSAFPAPSGDEPELEEDAGAR